jgi:hypothetical protein
MQVEMRRDTPRLRAVLSDQPTDGCGGGGAGAAPPLRSHRDVLQRVSVQIQSVCTILS